MTTQVIQTREELLNIVDSIPYNVFCMQDINELAFPIVSKWLLIEPDTVYLVPFDAGNLLDFYEIMAGAIQRPGIEGYSYSEAQPTQAIEGTSAGPQDTNDTAHRQGIDPEIRQA